MKKTVFAIVLVSLMLVVGCSSENGAASTVETPAASATPPAQNNVVDELPDEPEQAVAEEIKLTEASAAEIESALSGIAAPGMRQDIFEKTDAEIVAWLQEVEAWFLAVATSPNGYFFEDSATAIKEHLELVFTKEMAEFLFKLYIYQDDQGRYMVVEGTDANLGLSEVAGESDLRIARVDEGVSLILEAPGVKHLSSYRIPAQGMKIAHFTTFYGSGS